MGSLALEEVEAGEGAECSWLTKQLLARAERQVQADPVGWTLWPLLALAADEATAE